MSALSIQPTYPIFTDIDGQPLEDVFVWIGQANLDPQVNPINVFWDAALTIPAGQPIRTLGGYPSNSGTPARLYVNSDYSIRVMNKNSSVVYSAPTATERYSGVVLGEIDGQNVTFIQAGTGAEQTNMQSKVRQHVSVLDFIPESEHAAIRDGTSTYDAYADIQAAIDYALTQSSRILQGIGTPGFPYKMMEVEFPSGLYNTSSTLILNNAGYGVVRLTGLGRATIRYTAATGTCVYLYPIDPGLPLMTAGVQMKDICIWKDDKAEKSVGLVVERMTNCYFEGFESFYGFQYAIQVNGGIDNEFDFKGQPIMNCDYGMWIQQKIPPSGIGIMKPNLTTVRNAYLINTAIHSMVYRKNADEPAGAQNSPGSVHLVADTNFQGGCSGAAVIIETLGENGGTGTINFERCWWEGASAEGAMRIANGAQVRVQGCFYTNQTTNEKPFLLMDGSARLIIEELDLVMGSAPLNNYVVQRFDGTTNGIALQFYGRRNRLVGAGIPAPKMGPQDYFIAGNSIYPDHVIADQIITSRLSSLSGITASLGSGGTENIFQIDGNTGSRTYLVTCRQFDGGQAWRGVWVVQGDSGGSFQVTTLNNSNVTLTGSGANVILTNTNPLSMSLVWNAVQIGQ